MYTIVVADDEYELRKAIIQRIDWESIGFEVVAEAENGIEALEYVEKYEPDLLLTDIKMPFLSGIDLARKVREIRPATQIAFLSGYDDFSYAQQAIQYNIIKYLLKPISSQELTLELTDIKNKMDELNEVFTKQNALQDDQYLLERFLTPLIFDHEIESVEEERYIEIAQDLDIVPQLNKTMEIIVLTIKLITDKEENMTQYNHIQAVNNIIGKYLKHGSLFSHNKIISVVTGMRWEVEKYLDILVNEIQQSCTRALSCQCYIGVSQTYQHFSELHHAYLESHNALMYSRNTHQYITFIKDIEQNQSLKYNEIDDMTLELEHILKAGKLEDLECYLTSVFQQVINLTFVDVDIDMLMIRFITHAYHVVYTLCSAQTAGKLADYPLDFSVLLSKETSLHQKRKIVRELCLSCKKIIEDEKSTNSSTLIDEFMTIIHDDFANEDLSLASVSERLNISSSYLSALVKKYTGETFIALLTKRRMQVAKEMVMYSKEKLLVISHKCGYNDQHYFSYCFKKYYQLSPNKMRELKDVQKV